MSNKKAKERHYYKDITGQKFNKLTVIKYVYTKRKRAYWLCKCECGNETIIPTTALKSGNTKSCGCLHNEQTKINIAKAILNQTKYKTDEERELGRKYTCLNIPKGTISYRISKGYKTEDILQTNYKRMEYKNK